MFTKKPGQATRGKALAVVVWPKPRDGNSDGRRAGGRTGGVAVVEDGRVAQRLMLDVVRRRVREQREKLLGLVERCVEVAADLVALRLRVLRTARRRRAQVQPSHKPLRGPRMWAGVRAGGGGLAKKGRRGVPLREQRRPARGHCLERLRRGLPEHLLQLLDFSA